MLEKKVFTEAPLVWIDLEMTGLDATKDVIIEIAVVLTDSQLSEIARGPHLVVSQPQHVLDNMNEVCTTMHTKSGLTTDVINSTTTLQSAQEQVVTFLKEYCQPGQSPLCGNSVWQDKIFLAAYMPDVSNFLHYRIIDVSTIKQLVQRWYPENEAKKFQKKEVHRALDDIYESIDELKWYRQHFFVAK
ncbi:MAG TPA: oligoribonuclease [Candidatus Babeliales bacterium]|nr:oligoribonuclease [Candidatus Babeliales bacterium]